MPPIDHIAREFWRAHKMCGSCEKPLTYRDVAFYLDPEGVVNMVHYSCMQDDNGLIQPEQILPSMSFREPRAYVAENQLALLPQLSPQRSRAFKDLEPEVQDTIWESPLYWAERKYDGIRALLHFTKDGIRLQTGRTPSRKTNRLHEPTDNFPHIRDLPFEPKFYGTVLDAEIIIEKEIDTGATQTKGYLAGTVAVANASPTKATTIQKENDAWASCYLFDILFLADRDLRNLPQQTRRGALEKFYSRILSCWSTTNDVRLAEIATLDKQGYFQEIVELGGEGVMLKHKDKPYVGEGRPPHWFKVKRVDTIDAVVTGFIPGKHGYEGLIGALEVSVYESEQLVPIAAVSQMTLEFRKSISHRDEHNNLILAPTLYNQVVEICYQELTKSQRGRHAVLLRFRMDKSPQECTISQIRGE